MPHLQWLAVARTGQPTSAVWIRLLIGVVVGALLVAVGSLLVR